MLYDEPTSALDPEMIKEVLDVIQALSREGMTSVIVTHEMAFARRIADRVMFVDGGRIVDNALTADFLWRRDKSPRSKLSGTDSLSLKACADRSVACSRRSARRADHVQERLSAFVFRDRHRALERGWQRRWILHTFAVTARGLADPLERRELVEVNERRPVAPRRSPASVHGEGRALDRSPHAVVHDDEEHR
jgi:ABC-type multidrug transport system ATPase subunit